MGNKNLNKVMLIGRLGADPEVRYTPSGRANVAFNLATNAVWKDQDGNKQERTDWHRVVAWGKLAEIIGEYLKKGSRIFLEGRLQTRSYEDNGQKRYITEVIADSLDMPETSEPSEPSKYDQQEEPSLADDLPF